MSLALFIVFIQFNMVVGTNTIVITIVITIVTIVVIINIIGICIHSDMYSNRIRRKFYIIS